LGATTNPGLFSSLGSGIGSFFSGIGSLFATGALIDRGQRYPFATGGVFGAGPRWGFASGDVFTDPTTMPMATIGEAGPEAVMPLRRGADGRLGIATSGGGNGGPQIVVNAPISVGQNALQNNGQMSQKQIVDLQRQLGTAVRRSVQTEIANQTRPGGMVQPQA
jgi:phage-related minor tail protein